MSISIALASQDVFDILAKHNLNCLRTDVSGNPHGEHESARIQTRCKQNDEDELFPLATGFQLLM